MKKEIINAPEIPGSPFFSQAVKAGSTIFLSGIAGVDPVTKKLAGENIQEQTRQSLKNCETILNAAGARLADVVDVQVLLSRPSDFAGLNEEYSKFFSVNPPARSVCKLGVEVPNLLVSIKMTALI